MARSTGNNRAVWTSSIIACAFAAATMGLTQALCDGGGTLGTIHCTKCEDTKAKCQGGTPHYCAFDPNTQDLQICTWCDGDNFNEECKGSQAGQRCVWNGPIADCGTRWTSHCVSNNNPNDPYKGTCNNGTQATVQNCIKFDCTQETGACP